MLAVMLPYLRLSALCLLSCLGSCQAQKDLTLEPEASGAEVVQAVVAKIETSGIFPTDNRLLRRIAYVESKDGTDSATCQRGYCGGIWQVDEFGFHDTQNTTSNPDLVDSHHAIAVQFGITWSTVEMGELLKPFYSGLAARLRLASVLEKIPLSSDIAAQAAYWKQHYSSEFTNETLQKFEDDVGVLEGIEGNNYTVNNGSLAQLTMWDMSVKLIGSILLNSIIPVLERRCVTVVTIHIEPRNV